MLAETYRIQTGDGHSIFVRHWPSKNAAPRALIHILHGMAEHSERYARLAEALTRAGFDVVAHDHRGHGHSVANPTDLGHYGGKDSWKHLVNDVLLVQQHALQSKPGLPVVLFAHSMGSFIAQAFAIQHSNTLAGLIISGSNYNPPSLYRFLRRIAWLERLRLGQRGRSSLLDFLSFGSFNKKFNPSRTSFDWLSRDPLEVDKYINDPLCGFICTTQTWMELCSGLIEISTLDNLKKITPKLPIYLFYGENDPVSGAKHSVEILRKNLQLAGVTDVSCRMYPNGRHEMLNEINRDEVITDALNWLNNHFAATEKKLNHA
ncbi:MAG TPA: alpha/beta hydrolase [Pseudomonadales bacterium]|nr:alpha/beta hydrolase [Pseudomonadales bacterium]